MSTIGSRLPIRRPIFWFVALGLALSALILSWSFTSPNSHRRQIEEATFRTPLPARPAESGSTIRTIVDSDDEPEDVDGILANPAFTEPALASLRPKEPDLQLIDASPLGPLPRIAEDGRRPLQTYARPYDAGDANPKIAIVVTGLGLQADATNASFHLPGAVSLMFSPYADDLPALFERARLAGHEVLMELPMEPEDYPTSDPGPHTLRASGTVDANLERLTWILSRAQGYFAVGGHGGAFADSPEAIPVMRALAGRGLGMVEIDGEGLALAGEEVDLPYLSAPDWIDGTPSADAIDQALAELEAGARQDGSAIGIAEPYPITLKRLVEWATTLEGRGLSLVPASAIMLERAEPAGDGDEDASLARSDN